MAAVIDSEPWLQRTMLLVICWLSFCHRVGHRRSVSMAADVVVQARSTLIPVMAAILKIRAGKMFASPDINAGIAFADSGTDGVLPGTRLLQRQVAGCNARLGIVTLSDNPKRPH